MGMFDRINEWLGPRPLAIALLAIVVVFGLAQAGWLHGAAPPKVGDWAMFHTGAHYQGANILPLAAVSGMTQSGGFNRLLQRYFLSDTVGELLPNGNYKYQLPVPTCNLPNKDTANCITNLKPFPRVHDGSCYLEYPYSPLPADVEATWYGGEPSHIEIVGGMPGFLIVCT